MKFWIITIFPQIFDKVFDFGIIKHAVDKKIVNINILDLRDFARDENDPVFKLEKHEKVDVWSYRQVDDRPYGGGPGMVFMMRPLVNAIQTIKNGIHENGGAWDEYKPRIVFLSPKGTKLTQEVAERLSKEKNLVLICGRYEGIDQRFIDNYVDEEISIGDYVLSGGEIPAMVLVDCVSRLVPQVIKNDEFNKSESFSDPQDRTKLDYPVYTRPADFDGLKVPEVLLNGNHKEIGEWRNRIKKS